MRIACVGAGPGGLYFAVLAKRAHPEHEITVYERNRPDDTFGFGVVFSDATVGGLLDRDRDVAPELLEHAMRWDPFTVVHQGQTIRAGGVGFSALERATLLRVLQRRASEAGVQLVFEHDVPDPRELREADLLVGSDGVGSAVRRAFEADFRPRIELGPTHFSWLGTDRPYDSLTFFFEQNQHGWFGAHVYPYRPDRATFIVETDAPTFARAGLDAFSEADTVAYCEELFRDHLRGHRLYTNRSLWQRFRTVSCGAWHHERAVLLGDAAHTAHFSVGSGTKMAMEDALALSSALERFPGDVPAALAAYQEVRRPQVQHVQEMAATSFEWWAGFRHYTHWPPEQLSFHFLTRSQFRYETLQARDPEYVRRVEAATDVDVQARLIAVEPPGGNLDELERLATRHPLALTRLLPVSDDGRITSEDGRLADYARLARRLPLGAQLGHAGARGACRPRRLGIDRPLPPGQAWPLLDATIGRHVMDRVRDDFASSAAEAAALGFRFLQLHFAHGYLLATFLSPLTNRRTDQYGGSIEHRLRFPLEVLEAARAAFPGELAVAISGTDWQPGGLTGDDLLTAARALRDHGADFVTVLGGQTTPRSLPPYGRCFQMLPAGRVRTEAGVPVIAAGGVTDLADAKTILLAGRADRCLLDPAPS